MSMLTVTGFGPFRDVLVNPSSVLAPQLSDDCHILQVDYTPVEGFARSWSGGDILCLGVNSRASDLQFELYAHNQIGVEPGASGRAHRRTQISRSGPQVLGQTLATPAELIDLPIATSFTPGDYLCNFLLYSLLKRHSGSRVGFVHVPPFSVVSEAQQLVQLRELIEYLELR